jgi:hypothetical protein
MAVESAVGKRYAWIFGGEGVAIFIAVNVLANIGQSAFLLPTIGVIVGLYFLPLARLFCYTCFIGSPRFKLGFSLAPRLRCAPISAP